LGNWNFLWERAPSETKFTWISTATNSQWVRGDFTPQAMNRVP
jgi:hypothetical protein